MVLFGCSMATQVCIEFFISYANFDTCGQARVIFEGLRMGVMFGLREAFYRLTILSWTCASSPSLGRQASKRAQLGGGSKGDKNCRHQCNEWWTKIKVGCPKIVRPQTVGPQRSAWLTRTTIGCPRLLTRTKIEFRHPHIIVGGSQTIHKMQFLTFWTSYPGFGNFRSDRVGNHAKMKVMKVPRPICNGSEVGHATLLISATNAYIE